MAEPILTLDLGGTSMRAALWDGAQLSERREARTPQPATFEATVAALAELARPLAGRASRLGVATAGAVTRGRVTATATETFPDWVGVPLAARLEAALGLSSSALNDARAAAWGEFQVGAGRGVSEFMFITVSTGVGAGLVLGGRLHLAANGLDAELGFVSVPAARRPMYAVPPLGDLTPLEYETSGRALDRFNSTGAGARDLADRAEAGDGVAEAVYGRSAALIAWKIADVAALLGVQKVALGGSVGLRPGYLARVWGALGHFPVRYRPEVVPAALGADAGLIGAAVWAGRMGVQDGGA